MSRLRGSGGRSAAALLRSTPGGNSDAPFALRLACWRRSVRVRAHHVFMREIISDILDDPHEYMPALVFMAVLLSIWLGSSMIGAFSLRRAVMRRGRPWLTFCLAVIPLLCGFIGVSAQIPFSWKGRTVNVSCDLHWF